MFVDVCITTALILTVILTFTWPRLGNISVNPN